MLRSRLLSKVGYCCLSISTICNIILYIKLFLTGTESASLRTNTCITILGNIVICIFLYNSREVLYQHVRPLIIMAGFAVILLTALLETVYLLKFAFRHITLRKCILAACILGIGAVYALINLPIFQMWVRWDSYAYLFDFYKLSPAGLFTADGMHVAQHLTTAYGLLAVGLQSIINADMRIVLCILNIAFMFGIMLLFYFLFRTYTPKTSPFISLLYAVAFSLSPYVFGATSSFSLETIMLFSLLLLLYGDATENEFLLLLGAFMLCNSKETGVVITCGVMIVRIIRDLIKARARFAKGRVFRTFFSAINLPVCVSVALVGIFWLIEFSSGSWTATNDDAMYTIDGSIFNSFGFSPLYIASKLKTLLFANFNWLVIALIAIAFLGVILRRKNSCLSVAESLRDCLIPASAIAAGCAFFFLFITYNHFRYWSPIIAPLYVICYILLHRLFSNRQAHAAVAITLGCLLCMQCFTTIDPVMLATHGTIDTGKGSIVSAADSVIGREEAVFVDSASYNHQIMFFDEAFDLLLEEVDFNRETSAIVLTSDLSCPTVGGTIGSLHMLTGFGYKFMDVPRYISWDSETQRRMLSQNPEDEICIGFYSIEKDPTLIDRLKESYSDVYYIEIPWHGEEDVADITARYEAEECAAVAHKGWTLRAYKF